jgi:hypothetical protein
MKNKIKEYVQYQFRFDKSDETKDLIEEIVANLYDRYDEFLLKYHDEEKAYLEAIKQMGDFHVKPEIISDEYSLKPSWPDISMIVSVILAIFGLIITLISILIGAIITAASISIYAASCYYLYSYSQYIMKNEKDITKHNSLLKKIFQYMKTCFTFWAISLSILFSNLLTSLIVLIKMALSRESNDGLLGIYIITFVISLIACAFLFIWLYRKLSFKHYYLTGETNIPSYLAETRKFLNIKESFHFSFANFFTNKFFIFFINFLTIIISFSGHMLILEERIIWNNNSHTTIIDTVYLLDDLKHIANIIVFVFLIISVIINILMLISKKGIYKTLATTFNTIFMGVILCALIAISKNYEGLRYELMISENITAIVISLAVSILYLIFKNKRKKLTVHK